MLINTFKMAKERKTEKVNIHSDYKNMVEMIGAYTKRKRMCEANNSSAKDKTYLKT